jgi:hypothetical protein
MVIFFLFADFFWILSVVLVVSELLLGRHHWKALGGMSLLLCNSWAAQCILSFLSLSDTNIVVIQQGYVVLFREFKTFDCV